jgi:hypothetical protein
VEEEECLEESVEPEEKQWSIQPLNPHSWPTWHRIWQKWRFRRLGFSRRLDRRIITLARGILESKVDRIKSLKVAKGISGYGDVGWPRARGRTVSHRQQHVIHELASKLKSWANNSRRLRQVNQMLEVQ